MDYGLVSIICPMHNCEKYINKTIECVLNQTYKNFELLIVDRNEKNISLINSYNDQRIKLLKIDVNDELIVSYNYALCEAKGKYVAFLNGGFWMPNKLEKQLSFMENNNYLASYTDFIEIDQLNKELGILVTGPRTINKKKSNRFSYMTCLTFMYNRDVIGHIQVDGRNINYIEYSIWLQIIRKTNCYLLDDCLAKYRRRTGSISNVSIKTLIKYHYRLFRISEKRNPLSSVYCIFKNLLYVLFKKKNHIKNYNVINYIDKM